MLLLKHITNQIQILIIMHDFLQKKENSFADELHTCYIHVCQHATLLRKSTLKKMIHIKKILLAIE